MTCPTCKEGKMVLRKSFYGEFLGCNNYPKCQTMMKIVEGKVDVKNPVVKNAAKPEVKGTGKPEEKKPEENQEQKTEDMAQKSEEGKEAQKAEEVKEGNQFGAMIETKQEIKSGDTLEIIECRVSNKKIYP